ncbi:hypothetical protein PF007_g13784 [Phytophthora fragariae]|uniref:Transmembrane protein n=1 Tax=Phytophthora fragariae TaxID=53985 RepID=A0A6A3RW43_9STRA|nr:hypothetical protein PF007_g13784 [Phytophthora fragariae]
MASLTSDAKSSGIWLKSSSKSMSLSSEELSLSLDSLPAELRGDPLVLLHAAPPDPFVLGERREYEFYGLEPDGALRPGGQVPLLSRRAVGLLLNYACIGGLYGGINSVVVPFLSRYLELEQYQLVWRLLQSRAMWQLLIFQLVASFTMSMDSTAASAIEPNWVDVEPWPKTVATAVWYLAFVGGLLATRHFLLRGAWGHLFCIATFWSVGVEVVTVACTVFHVVRRRSFWLYMPVLAAPAMALRFLVLVFPIIELAPRGAEGTTYGLVITFRNVAIPLGTTAYKAINSYFSVSDEDVTGDSESTRMQVSYPYLIAWAFQLFSLAFVGLLPHQKLEVQQLRYYGGYSTSGGWFVMIVLISVLIYISTANVLSLFKSTSCLRMVGGAGC